MWNLHRPKGECRNKIIKRAKNTMIFIKVYIFMMVGLTVAFGFPPLQYMLSQYLTRKSLNYTYDYSVRVFIIEYPFDINSPLIYWPILCQEFWILIGLATCWVTGDTLFASLITQLTIQFEILENDINSQVKHDTNEINLKRNLIILVHRHRMILRVTEELERIFSPIIFVNAIVASMIICVNVFVIEKQVTAGIYMEAAYNTFITMNTFLQITVYYVFAETLTQTCLSISNTIYECGWENQNRDIRTYIQILLMKTQKPIYYTAYGLFTLTHEQLIKIGNTAVSYYMMLRTTNQRSASF
ncbi:odorant receptor 45a-like [Phymastichus coffea]|uniref:odorant receptor 45a-like n=1 Tax=Phymastichus coffea TaxID=108790 RepID=UPI00273CB49F|nr:odorant receptor 45a-like [Phymastichus coffea]